MDNFKELIKEVKGRFKDEHGILKIIDEMEDDLLSTHNHDCINLFKKLHERANKDWQSHSQENTKN